MTAAHPVGSRGRRSKRRVKAKALFNVPREILQRTVVRKGEMESGLGVLRLPGVPGPESKRGEAGLGVVLDI